MVWLDSNQATVVALDEGLLAFIGDAASDELVFEVGTGLDVVCCDWNR